MKVSSLRSAYITPVLAGFLALGGIMASTNQAAAEPSTLGTYKAWRAYSASVGGQKTCYAISEPEDSLPRHLTHGDVVFMVTNWASRSIKNEPNFITGYSFKEGSTVTAEVGSSKWELFIDQNRAWLREAKEERSLVQAMKRGSTLRVKGTSTKGNQTEYRFSLSGISAAIKRIDADCK